MSKEQDEISRKNVQLLLREFSGHRYENEEVRRLGALVDAREEELAKDKELTRLKAAHDKARNEFQASERRRQIKVQKVRQLFYAVGPTPEVIRQLEALVKEFNGEEVR